MENFTLKPHGSYRRITLNYDFFPVVQFLPLYLCLWSRLQVDIYDFLNLMYGETEWNDEKPPGPWFECLPAF